MNALIVWARMIKLSHSIFALPFALAAGLLAARTVETTPTQWALIVLCMVTARASAMGFNRIVDRQFDAANPRTATREIPSGQIGVPAAWAFTLASAALFVLGSGLLGWATLALSPVALAVVWGYSLAKRFTALAHVILGLALGLAPIAVWIALTGTVAAPALLLSLGVATWVAGFDILYACQDADFDRSAGLYSVPARLGLPRALQVSAALHVATVASFAAVARVVPMGPAYLIGVAIIAGVLLWEHSIVKADDLSRLDKAFFDLNGYIALLFFASVWLA
jgi:4-hydroxybenzoate polyprenyltransferase